jgi:hypothetical protein
VKVFEALAGCENGRSEERTEVAHMADDGVRCLRKEKAGLAFIGECALAKGSRSRCTGSWHGRGMGAKAVATCSGR